MLLPTLANSWYSMSVEIQSFWGMSDAPVKHIYFPVYNSLMKRLRKKISEIFTLTIKLYLSFASFSSNSGSQHSLSSRIRLPDIFDLSILFVFISNNSEHRGRSWQKLNEWPTNLDLCDSKMRITHSGLNKREIWWSWCFRKINIVTQQKN